MVRITLEGVGKTPAAQKLDEHWRDIRKSLWKQVLRQEKNSSRVFYNGNHLLSPSGANIVFRCQDNQVVFAHELILKDCSPFWNEKLLPSDRRKPNNVYDYEIDAISVNKLWDPFGRIIVLIPGVKSHILKHCLQIIYCGESQIKLARERRNNKDNEDNSDDDDVKEVTKVLKDLFQIKLGGEKNKASKDNDKNSNTDFKENKRQNVDDENKPNEKISERFCLDPFSTDRWKEEFDSEATQEGRTRTNEEQDLSVEDFNKIQLNELNTKGSKPGGKRSGYSQLKTVESNNSNQFRKTDNSFGKETSENKHLENMARYNPLYNVSKTTKERDSVDDVSDVIKSILGKNMRNRRLHKSPSPDGETDNEITNAPTSESEIIHERNIQIEEVRNNSRFPSESEIKSETLSIREWKVRK